MGVSAIKSVLSWLWRFGRVNPWAALLTVIAGAIVRAVLKERASEGIAILPVMNFLVRQTLTLALGVVTAGMFFTAAKPVAEQGVDYLLDYLRRKGVRWALYVASGFSPVFLVNWPK